VALNQDAAIGFLEAMQVRAGGLVANCVLGGVAAAIGWALGVLIPEREGTKPETDQR
jgi:hypothetical protein